MLVLTWNLFHGRAQPPAGRDLLDEFAERLSGWEWDVALLQEVPPWWPAELARACAASSRQARTSRNLGIGPRRWLAEHAPDLIKSNGGGANAILVRGAPIEQHRVHVLRHLPERRVAHAVRVGGLWIGNLHAQAHSERHAQDDLNEAARTLVRWSGDAPRLILGGDTNTRRPGPPGFTIHARRDVDALMSIGMTMEGRPQVLEHAPLSDHEPLRARLVEG